ncbi:MAG: hypothetical protein BIFFINMI_01525 [Phycisphaerae bacterium]|nr:hypothetical protein [Phycisphaerae bacterium]
MALAPVAAVLIAALTGCEDKQLIRENQDLRGINEKLRIDNDSLQSDKRQLNQQVDSLLLKIQQKDDLITRLQNTIATAPPVQPVAPTPPTPPVPPITPSGDGNTGMRPPVSSGHGGGRTGFEGEGEVSQANGVVTLTLQGDVVFASGQATVRSEAMAKLARVAQTIKTQYPGKRVVVRGHTDSDPIVKSHWKSNWELSQARAQNVADVLAKNGVSRNLVEVVGLADTDPRVSPEKTKADKSANRRVEVQVVVGR